MPTTTPYSGLDLKLRRVALRVRAKDLAQEMGVSISRVSHLEREAVVSEAMVSRYLETLATFRTSGTPETAQGAA